MKSLLIILLLGLYYVVIGEGKNIKHKAEKYQRTEPLKVYWNIPTFQCRSKNIPFQNLNEKYGILQNKKDEFRGDQISILYHPGHFSTIIKNQTGEWYINGGVPQNGNLTQHLLQFIKDVKKDIPDEDFDGVAIIDNMELWRPTYRQNFGKYTTIKEASYNMEKTLNPWMKPYENFENEASTRFTPAARAFMEETLKVAKELRPNALWGYYAYPYCYNMAKDLKEDCSQAVQDENDEISWLWSESTALYPSAYSSSEYTPAQQVSLIRGRITEAARLRPDNIYVYLSLTHTDNKFLEKETLDAVLSTVDNSKASGIIIWGSSNDVNTKEKCHYLRDYVDETFGPIISQYTLHNRRNKRSTHEAHKTFKKNNKVEQEHKKSKTNIEVDTNKENIEKVHKKSKKNDAVETNKKNTHEASKKNNIDTANRENVRRHKTVEHHKIKNHEDTNKKDNIPLEKTHTSKNSKVDNNKDNTHKTIQDQEKKNNEVGALDPVTDDEDYDCNCSGDGGKTDIDFEWTSTEDMEELKIHFEKKYLEM